MFPTALIIASAVLGGASAAHHEPEALNQLETARLPQAAQRVEFGVQPGEDQASPFKFRFSDPVSTPACLHACFTAQLAESRRCRRLHSPFTARTRAGGQRGGG